MSKTVRPHDIEHQSHKAVHVFASRDAGAFALVGFAGFYLLCPSGFTVSPEGLHGLAGLAFIIDKIKSHLFPVASKGCAFFAV
jgi:hypothetical protein